MGNDLIADGIINYFSDTICWISHWNLQGPKKTHHANLWSSHMVFHYYKRTAITATVLILQTQEFLMVNLKIGSSGY